MYCDDVLTNAIAAKNRQSEEENTRLKDLNREMVKLLKEIERLEVWNEYVEVPIFECPFCGNLDVKGHHVRCELGKLLVKVGGEGE